MFYVWWPFVTWSWPWTELNIKHLLNQCLALYFRSTRSTFWPKTDNFEVSTARNLNAPIFTFDLTLTWHVWRDLIWKIEGVLEDRLIESFRTPHRWSVCGHLFASYDVERLTLPPPPPRKSRVAKYPSNCRVKRGSWLESVRAQRWKWPMDILATWGKISLDTIKNTFRSRVPIKNCQKE